MYADSPIPVARILLAVATCVLVPITGSLYRADGSARGRPLDTFERITRNATWGASLLVAYGLVFCAPNARTGILAIPWVLTSMLHGLLGVRRFVRRSAFRLEESMVDLGRVYLVVGGIWLYTYASGSVLPIGNLTSVLRLDSMARAPLALETSVRAGGRRPFTGERGLLLGTLQVDDQAVDGDQGVYLVTWLGPFRLPLDETIAVWDAADDPTWREELGDPPLLDPARVALLATHDLWIFGLRYLRLTYYITRRHTERTN